MFKELSENSQQFSTRGRSTTRRQGVYEVNTNDGVHVEMAAMNTKIDMLVKAMSSLSGKQASRTELFLRSDKVVDNKVGVDDKEPESEVVGASPTKAMASKKVSEKEKVILPPFPQRIGNHLFDQALLDLGASINLLPYALYQELRLGELKPTLITLQLADKSVKRPRGILEDVLVKVNEFILPADFVVLDMEESSMSSSLPIILGRPFMITADTKICVKKGTISMKVNGEKIEFKVFDAM
ncbi:hypothetical protein ACFX2B_013337 [Malus domestica]